MTPQERAEKIVTMLRKLPMGQEEIDFIAAQIEEAEREAMQKHLCPPDLACKHCFKEGFTAAREKAKGIALSRWTCPESSEPCDDIVSGMGCHCPEDWGQSIADRIGKMEAGK